MGLGDSVGGSDCGIGSIYHGVCRPQDFQYSSPPPWCLHPLVWPQFQRILPIYPPQSQSLDTPAPDSPRVELTVSQPAAQSIIRIVAIESNFKNFIPLECWIDKFYKLKRWLAGMAGKCE